MCASAHVSPEGKTSTSRLGRFDSAWCRRNVERAVHRSREGALLAKNESLLFGGSEIGERLTVSPQRQAIGFVGRQAVERDQSPGDVVRALVRQEVPQQVPAAAWDDASPVFGVLVERFLLKRIDLIPDETGDGRRDHRRFPFCTDRLGERRDGEGLPQKLPARRWLGAHHRDPVCESGAVRKRSTAAYSCRRPSSRCITWVPRGSVTARTTGAREN